MTLRHASDVVRKDKDFIRGIATQKGFFFQRPFGERRNDRQVVLDTAKHHGSCLNIVSNEIKFNNEVF